MSNTTFLQEPEPEDREQFLELYFKDRLQSLDRVTAGYTDVSLTGLTGNVDLSPTQAKHRRIRLTGAPAGAVTLRIPHATGANCDIILVNACSGSFSTVTVKSTGANAGNASGVSLTTARTRIVAHDGESVYPVTADTDAVLSALYTSLVAAWKLEEASGARADSHGANALTDNNTVTQAAGKIGSAAQFTAANSEHLSIADNAAMSTGDIDFTFAGWLYLDSKTAVRGVFEKDNNTAGQREYGLYYTNADDRLHFYVFTPGDVYAEVIASAFGSPAVSTWIFFVVWHDAAANTINIQVNGGTVNSTAHAAGVKDAAATFSIGQGGGNSYMDGRVDALNFWKRVLTAGERAELYNAGAGRAYPF